VKIDAGWYESSSPRTVVSMEADKAGREKIQEEHRPDCVCKGKAGVTTRRNNIRAPEIGVLAMRAVLNANIPSCADKTIRKSRGLRVTSGEEKR